MNRFFTAFLTLFLVSFSSLQALTLDEFNETETQAPLFEDRVFSINTGIAVRSQFTVPTVLGGRRVMEANKVSGANKVELAVVGGSLSHSGGSLTTGDTLVIWDGDDTPAGFNPIGLRGGGASGIDFKNDIAIPDINADGFYVDIESLDPHTITINFKVYTDGSHSSVLSKNIVGPIVGGTEVFLFKDFTALGANPADFTNVGAIIIEIIGTPTPDIDLSIDRIYTNGCKTYVPTPSSSAADQCGVVCGSNACLDCLGLPDVAGTGPNRPGLPCLTGDPGLCSTGIWTGTLPNNCTCTPDNTPTGELCDGLDNDCDGDVDEAFPTLGDACSIGADLCSVNGIIECDAAKVGLHCTADDKQADVDACDHTRGCDGVPNSGLVLDACKICGGDGSSCADCAGTPNGTATLDRCNECDGDGLSCLECVEYDISETQAAMDGGAKDQEKNIRRVLRELKRIDQEPATLDFIAVNRAKAHELQILNWTLSWTLPSVYSECINSFCVNASNEPQVSEYIDRSLELKKLGARIIKYYQKVKLAKGRSLDTNDKRFVKRNRQLHNTNVANANSVPLTVSSCS